VLPELFVIVKDPFPLVIVGVLKACPITVTPTVFVLFVSMPSQVIAFEVLPEVRFCTCPAARKWDPAALCPNISEVPFALNICIPYDMKELY